MDNQLYIEDHILMISAYPVPKTHRHIAAHLIFADSGVLRCLIEGQELETPAIMIASEVSHTAYAKGGRSIVLLFDVASELARNMNALYLKGKPYYILPDAVADAMRDFFHKTSDDLAAFDDKLLDLLGLRQQGKNKMDERIERTITDLKSLRTIPENVFEQAYKNACLSESRFSHLFSKDVGIPFKRYLVMIKLRKAYEGYLEGLSITEISMRAGFDSPSHFAATIQRMFGLSFSDFSKSM